MANGPSSPKLFPLSELPEQVLKDVILCVRSADAYRLRSVSRALRSSVDAFLPHQPVDPLQARVPSEQRHGLHHWGSLERQTRGKGAIPLENLPAFADAFELPVAASAAEQQPDSQQGQQQPDQPDQPVAPQPAAALHQQQQQEEASRPRLQLLSAAALFGGWWGATAGPGAGAAAGIDGEAQANRDWALNHRLHELLEHCLGSSVADQVQAITGCPECPAAAKGLWGCVFLGLLLATTKAAKDGGAALLVHHLLSIDRSRFLPADLVQAASSGGAPAPAAAAPAAGTVQEQRKGREVYSARYHAQEFLSAVLVLLRCKPLAAAQLWDRDALQELESSILQAMRMHEARERTTNADRGLRDFGPAHAAPDELKLVQKDNYGLPTLERMTTEQTDIVKHAVRVPLPGARTADELVLIPAFAGAAKSTTMKKVMVMNRGLTFLYTAFSRPVVNEAADWFCGLHEKRFQDSAQWNMDFVRCRSTHQLAREKRDELVGAMGRKGWQLSPSSFYRSHVVKNLQQVDFFVHRQMMGGKGPGHQHAQDVIDVLEVFLTTADKAVTDAHIQQAASGEEKFPRVKNFTDYVQVTQELYEMMRDDQLSGQVTITHNFYLKLFVMEVLKTGRQLDNGAGKTFDVIVVDEAQDMNPLTQQLIMSQRCTKVVVGDQRQAIFGFNGCRNGLVDLVDLAAERDMPVRTFHLTRSFRQGRPADVLVNRLLWILGERKTSFVGSSSTPTGVYALAQHRQQQSSQDAVVSAGAAGTAAADGPVAFRQLSMGDEPVTGGHMLPEQLSAITVSGCDGRTVYLAQAPVDPATGRRPPMCVLFRYNRTWFELLAAMFSAAVDGDGSAEGMPWVHLTAGAKGRRSKVADSEEGPEEGYEKEPVAFLDRLIDICNLRRWEEEGQPGKKPPSKWIRYESWQKLQEDEAKDLLSAENEAALRQLQKLGLDRTDNIVAAIKQKLVKAADKATADFILGTCHKAKGMEEDYVQLGWDFVPVASGMKPGIVVDEYNLVYVAATRAKRVLVLNEDLQQLVLGVQRLVSLQLGSLAATGSQQPGTQQPGTQQPGTQQQLCSSCFAPLTAAAAAESSVASQLCLQLHKAEGQQRQQQQQHMRPVCVGCIKAHTIWGELFCRCAVAEEEENQACLQLLKEHGF